MTPLGPQDLARVIVLVGEEPVVVSRCASPLLRNALHARGPVTEAPAVRGLTVWEAVAAGTACVIEQPNWWGAIEASPATRRTVVLDHARATIETADNTAPQGRDWLDRVRLANRTRKVLVQRKGVVAALPDVEAPWFVILQPSSAASVVAALPAALQPHVIAPAGWPELPGGLRIEVPAGAGRRWADGAVASLAEAMSGVASR